MNKEKIVTCLQRDPHDLLIGTRTITEEELRGEYAYELALDLLENMLDMGLITRAQLIKIDIKNRESFSPHLTSLLPELT